MILLSEWRSSALTQRCHRARCPSRFILAMSAFMSYALSFQDGWSTGQSPSPRSTTRSGLTSSSLIRARWGKGKRLCWGISSGGGAVAVWFRALDWRPGGPGCESFWRNFASELWQFRLPRLCRCLSEETLYAVDPFYLVYMPGEVKYPPQGVNV